MNGKSEQSERARSERARSVRARDDTLDKQIRAHFRAERAGLAVPAFERLLAHAEAAQRARARLSWQQRLVELFSSGPGAPVRVAAAALAVLFLVYVVADSGIDPDRNTENDQLLAAMPAVVAVSEEELVADLNSTTRWQAPSDRWLVVAQADVDVYGLPDLHDPAATLKEMDQWMY